MGNQNTFMKGQEMPLRTSGCFNDTQQLVQKTATFPHVQLTLTTLPSKRPTLLKQQATSITYRIMRN
jgi:hypothetical protein